MKRSNLLKVLSVIMVVAMLMMSTTTTFAAVTAEQNSTDTTIVMEGDLPGGTPYTEVVVRIYALTDLEDPESAVDTSKIVTVTQTKLLEDGSFICEIPMSSALPFLSLIHI